MLYIESFPAFKILIQIFIYFILLIFIMRIYKIDIVDKKVFILLFIFKLFVGVMFYVSRDNALGVNTGNDELVYYEFAKTYFDIGEFPFFAFTELNRGFVFYDWLHFIFFNEVNIMFIIITNIFIGIFTWIIFYEQLKMLFDSKKTFVIVFLSIIPEVMFFNFQNMRDTLILFFVVSFVKVFYNYITYKKINYLYIPFLIYITASLRFYNLLIEAFIFLFFALFITKRKRFQILLLGMVFFGLIAIMHPGVLEDIFLMLTNFREIVVLNIKAHSDYDFYLLPQFLATDTYTNSLVLKVFLTFFVTPNPYKFFDIDFIGQLVIVFDLLFLSLSFYLIREVINFRKLDNLEKIMILFILLYTIIILLSPYLSDYRHRGEIMPFLFILIFKNIFRYKLKLYNTIPIQFFTLLLLFVGIGILQ